MPQLVLKEPEICRFFFPPFPLAPLQLQTSCIENHNIIQYFIHPRREIIFFSHPPPPPVVEGRSAAGLRSSLLHPRTPAIRLFCFAAPRLCVNGQRNISSFLEEFQSQTQVAPHTQDPTVSYHCHQRRSTPTPNPIYVN